MRRTLPFLIALLLLAAPLRAGVRILAFYEVKPVDKPPVIDGSLDDACWKDVPRASTYFEYWKADPRPGALKSDFRMVYDHRGVYLAIVNYDEQARNVRKERTTRDDPGLWKDDCAEIYFDHTARGVGYRRFVVNAAGVQGDTRRVDAAVSLPNWSGSGWVARTKVYDDRWTIEAFFPYSDLGEKASPGDLWTFNHVRYAWTTGKFQGVTWSAEGNYNRPENFGYLHFGGAADTPARKLGEMLSRQVAPPWTMIVDKGFIVCEAAGKVDYVSASDRVAEQRDKLRKLLKTARQTVDEAKLPDPKNRFVPILDDAAKEAATLPRTIDDPLEALDTLRKIAALNERAEQAYWEARIAALLQSAQKQPTPGAIIQ